MSGTVVPGQEAGACDETKKENKSVDSQPERHDSKADPSSADTDTRPRGNSKGIAPAVAQTDWSQHGTANNASAVQDLDSAIARTHISSHHSPNHHSPTLHIETNQPSIVRLRDTPTIFETPVQESAGSQNVFTSPNAFLPSSSLRTNLSTSSMASTASAASSALNSPFLASMTDLTPLPSPRGSTELSRSGSWGKSFGRPPGPRSRGTSMNETETSSSHTRQHSASKKRKGYASLLQDAVEANAAAFDENSKVEGGSHGRNRSISDFVPEHLQNVKPRPVTLGPGDTAALEAHSNTLHREAYLASKRGVTSQTEPKQQQQLPSPPPSSSSVGESDEADEGKRHLEDGPTADYLEIHCGMNNKRRKFRQLRQLGQGTFSKVMLATREKVPANPTPEIEEHLDPAKLVAVKIVEQGPAGGADEQRIEIGLKREVEMLKSLSHPSLVHLKACEYQEHRALLVLNYCPGGDLYEFMHERRGLLPPTLIQRIFSELVDAVGYLHTNWIVHRDIKLENVLVNFPSQALAELSDPRSHQTPIVTLTDLGLSRRIPQPPESPLLTTRCGSEDYAAPEILLGQPYDGRQTDAWALGVLLYALMEARLPFDTPPGKPERSRNTHRIARCDWIWCRFGDEDGDWDASKDGDFEGARWCVEGLLRKIRNNRKPLTEIESFKWIQQGIRVPNGLRMRSEDEDDNL